MYQPHEKDDLNRLNKYIPLSSPKHKSNPHPIIVSLHRLGNLQDVRFEEIEKACVFLETCLGNTEETLARLDERIHQIQQMRSTQTISNLKQKQNEFFIHQLKEKIKKYQKNEINMEIELKHLKKQLQSLKRQQKLQHNQKSLNNSRIKQEMLQMEKVITQKDQQNEQLTKRIQKLLHDKKQDKKLQLNNNEKLKKDKDDYFRLLQGKLLELQRDFDSKVTGLQQEVKEKTMMVKKLEEELEKKQKEIEFKQKQFQIQFRSLQENKSLPLNLTQSQQLPSNMTMTFNPARKSLQSTLSQPSSSQQSSSNYELQLKLSHQQKLYKQLQYEHTTHLTQCNNLQIQLHQQIHQQKLQLQEEKKKSKTQKKKNIQLLQSLASFVNRRSFNYFDANLEVENFVEELKKMIGKEKQKWEKELQESKNGEKLHQQKIPQLEKQNRKLKSQNNLLKQQLQNISQQLQRLVTQKEKQKEKQKQKQKEREKEREKDRQRQQKRQNSSFVTESNNSNNNSQVKVKQILNGSLGEISNNGKSETTSILQDKYKTIIENLKNQIQLKQLHISELQALQSIDFQKSKEKILAIESQLADSRNQAKKLQRQCKQLKQKSAQHSKQSDSLKFTIQELREKHLREKQNLISNQQQKVKSLEQKLSKLKDQNQQIDSKCQEKVMKYNKLKGKVQKLQMYNSETEKRKDGQIEDLIKKNQHLKMDCKLLQEKLNIAQTLQLNTSTEGQEEITKSTYVYNKDLIEQIQMERDRILEQYETKRRQHIKLKQLHDRLNEENTHLKQEITKHEQYKQRLEQQKQNSTDQKLKQQQDRQRQLQQLQKTIAKLTQEKQSLSSQLTLNKKELSAQKNSKQSAEKQLAKIVQEQLTKSKQQYQHLKKQLQTQLQLKKKLQKQQPTLVQRIMELKEQNQKIKKENLQLKTQITQKAKSLQLRWQQKYKEKAALHHQEIAKLKDQHQRKTTDLEQKISQAKIREENFVNIINYKNMSVSGNVRESMKGDEEEYAFEEVKKYQLHELLPISEVKEFNFGQMNDMETSTNDIRDRLCIYKMESIAIEPLVLCPKLTIQTLPIVCIQSQKSYKEQSTLANIFQQEQQLLMYLKTNYPQILQQINQQSQIQLMEKLQSHQSKYQEKQEKQKQNIKEMTGENKQFAQIGINTQNNVFTTERKSLTNRQSVNNNRQSIGNTNNNRQSIKSGVKEQSFILEKDWLGSDEQSHSSVEHMPIPDSNGVIPPHVSLREKFNFEANKVGQINLFQNLKPTNLNLQIGVDQQNIDDNFQICQQGESINVGRTALNLQIKQIFNKLREQLQKVFNGQEISLSMIKILPRQLQDDYNEFIAYVRQKISQIKVQNQLSFIMAEVGDSPQELQEQLDNELRTFIEKKTIEDIFTYKKMVQQKQALITSLMNEKTMQQNTINQMTMEKQQMDEEHQNRFMNQCLIYKKEIKELKNKVDNLEMNFQSLKNIFKNTMEIWVDQMENQDDLRDNFIIYKKISKLTETQSTRLNYYIFRYREIKNIND